MNPSTTPVPSLDRAASARERRLFAQSPPWLHDDVAQSMVERLRWMIQPPATWLDWEPSWGGSGSAKWIGQTYPAAQRWVHERDGLSASGASPSRWGWLPGRRVTPLTWDGRTTVDMVWANMALRGEAQPEALMQQWLRALKPQGFVMFTGLGPHTLASLRAVYARRGWGEAFTPFTDMHDWGDMLVGQGFENPVLDSSFLNLTYSSVKHLLADLRLLGRNTHPARHPGLRSSQWAAALHQALESELERDASGRWMVTLEVIHGHAVSPAGVRSAGQVTAISEAQMRGLLQRR